MISIIIPNYNGKNLLSSCLKSIYKNSYLPEKIIVVDNGSTDGSIEYLESKYKDVKIIKNTKNLGFARAVNQAVEKSRNKYVAVINNDISLDKNWFKAIKEQIRKTKNKSIACWCGKILTKNGKTVESKGLLYLMCGKATNISNGKKEEKITNEKPKYVFGASGAATIYEIKAIIKSGLFDEDFFAYQEDVDLSLRLQKMGFKTLYVPGAVCFHRGGATSNKMGNFRQRMVFKNWIYIIIKNYPLKTILRYLPQIALERVKNLYDLIKNTPTIKVVPDLTITFIQIMLKSPRMISRRSPVNEKILKSLN